MPRIKLSTWYGDHAPGDEIDVDDAGLKALRRDGRVADVVQPAEAPAPADSPAEQATPEAAPETGRRKR
jgi:hypothetical protein